MHNMEMKDIMTVKEYEQMWNGCKWIWMDIIVCECMHINVNEWTPTWMILNGMNA